VRPTKNLVMGVGFAVFATGFIIVVVPFIVRNRQMDRCAADSGRFPGYPRGEAVFPCNGRRKKKNKARSP